MKCHDHSLKQTAKGTNLPKLSAPMERALLGVGITCLEDLTKFREADIQKLHGVGPNGMKILTQAMKVLEIKFYN